MTGNVLHAERRHLAGLLEAVQRCVYFLDASDKRIPWPLTAAHLEQNKKDVDLFESLAAINERFAKLQDTLGAAMRHSLVLSGEPGETFLKVLAFYDKAGVIDSVSVWQLCRATRNLAAHDYGTDYAEVAEHFTAPHPSAFLPAPSRGEGQGERVTAAIRPTPAIGLHPCRSGALAAIRAVAPSRHRPEGGPPTCRSGALAAIRAVEPSRRQQPRTGALAASTPTRDFPRVKVHP